MNGYSLYVGCDFTGFASFDDVLKTFSSQGCQFVTSPLIWEDDECSRLTKQQNTHSSNSSNSRDVDRKNPMQRVFPSPRYQHWVAGYVSPWLEFDSGDWSVDQLHCNRLTKELGWASHIGLRVIILPQPKTESMSNYARSVSDNLERAYHQTYWLTVKMISENDTGWKTWNCMRTLCNSHSQLCVNIVLTADLGTNSSIIDRWFGEPVRCVSIDTSLFLYDVASQSFYLSKIHQQVLMKFFTMPRIQILITGSSDDPTGSFDRYITYIHNLAKTLPEVSYDKEQTQSYRDYLQSPLQPLQDNLHDATYATFERCPVKYKLYKDAIKQALLDLPVEQHTVHVAVVGAGRGPLIDMALRAAEATQKTLVVYAIEKNPHAVVSLLRTKREVWGSQVTIVNVDMRDWKAPVEMDCVISELLGSFGDNECSPECLDGVIPFLKPSGISIPCSSTSFLAPVSTHRLWSELNARTSSPHFKHMETAYVCNMHNFFSIDDPQPCFRFTHSREEKQPVINNTRHVHFKFKAKANALMHGFIGYFDSQLYKDVHCSILPATVSENMNSWFPIFFPLRTPVLLDAGQTVECDIWRCATKDKVWYEWSLTAPQALPIHNARGCCSHIGL